LINPSKAHRTHVIWLYGGLVAAAVTASSLTVRAQQPTQQSTSKPAAQAKTGSTKTPPTMADGARVYGENCSRCHNPPEGFPQHVSGTIARHMRMRASLSEQDWDALLRFFNPK